MNADTVDVLTPLQYPITWVWISGSLVLLAIVFYITLLVMTRKRKLKLDVPMLPGGLSSEEKLSALRNKYAEEIISIQTAYKAKEISTRKAFQSISITIRNFSHEYSHTGAFAMTLTELEAAQTPLMLQEKIRLIYPVAFQQAEVEANVDLAVNDALEVIRLWR